MYLAVVSIPTVPEAKSPSISVPLDFVVIALAGAAFAGCATLIGMMAKREVDSFERRFADSEENQKQLIAKIDELGKSVSTLEAKLAQGYVSNDTWIHSQTTVDSRYDSLSRRMDQLLALWYEGKK